jgi:uncharacterized protein (DUF1697 family)
MVTYAAFIRGIMPMNPNMRNEKLRGVFEKLGFSDVQTVIASGNVIFKSELKDKTKLENDIQSALFKNLGFLGTTFIRSRDDLEKIIKKNPFKGATHSKETYLVVTFLKQKPGEFFNTINVSGPRAPEFMRNIEKEFGKNITTRTWKTIERMLSKMS